jgi:hypothetical protein
MDMRFNQTGHDRTPAQIDHANRAARFRRPSAHSHEPVVSDAHCIDDGIPRIHRVNLPIEEHKRDLIVECGSRALSGRLRGPEQRRSRRSALQKVPS